MKLSEAESGASAVQQGLDAARTYSLLLLFDGSQVSKGDLHKRIEKALEQVLGKKLTVKREGAKHLSACIEGSLEVVDRCHAELSENMLSRSDLRCFRLKDEAGDEIRLRAYPILSAIEQDTRAFINRAMVEVSGFERQKWRVPQELQAKIAQMSDSARKSLSLDPLEFMEFADLLAILSAEFPTWPPGRPLTPSDLGELLSESKTIDDLRLRLGEKTKVVSLWNAVFAKFFEKPEQRDSLQKALGFVIERRHKVMHHRPVRLGELKELGKKKDLIASLLESAKRKLSPEELVEARANAERVQSYVSALASMREMQQQWASPAALRIQEVVCRLASAPVGPVFTEAVEALRQLSKIQFDPALLKTIEINRLVALQQPTPAITRMIEEFRRLESVALESILGSPSLAQAMKEARQAAGALQDQVGPILSGSQPPPQSSLEGGADAKQNAKPTDGQGAEDK